ncbi:MAG: hypothetical protein NC235_14730 [Clostridiales bacterium]|nr:hypothetical protein [Clostridiales bacterium]
MKFFLLLLMLCFLTSCSIKAEKESDSYDDISWISSSFAASTLTTEKTMIETTESTTIAPTSAAIYADIPSIKEICNDVDTYFRMFYTNNLNYKWNGVEATKESPYNRYITGYFDGDSLVKMDVEAEGESVYILTTYYFINEDITYMTSQKNYGLISPFYTECHDYCIIDGKLWQYSDEMETFVEAPNRDELFYDELDYFEQDKYDVLENKPQYYVENTFMLPTESNLFVQLNEAKNAYFRKFFSVDRYDRDISNYSESNFYTLSYNSKLYELFVRNYNDVSYTEYVYYPIDDNFLYVIVYYQEFESVGDYSFSTKKSCGWNDDYNIMKKNCYKEFFVINHNVMQYDPEKQDLIASLDSEEILTNLNTAKDIIKIE